jgi:hypothetical protein
MSANCDLSPLSTLSTGHIGEIPLARLGEAGQSLISGQQRPDGNGRKNLSPPWQEATDPAREKQRNAMVDEERKKREAVVPTKADPTFRTWSQRNQAFG